MGDAVTLKRSELKRSTPMGRGSISRAEPKPAKGPKPVRCAVKGCRAPFVPERAHIKFCSPDCGAVLGIQLAAAKKAKEAKAERAADRRRKEEGLPHKKHLERVQGLANRIAVLRDWHHGCISCDKGPNWDGTWHGSHYKSVGSNSALRFNLWNISKSCSQCNWFMGGNIANYEPRLSLKIGHGRMEWLKNHPRSREYSTEYLIRYATIARRWIKRKEKRLGIR